VKLSVVVVVILVAWWLLLVLLLLLEHYPKPREVWQSQQPWKLAAVVELPSPF